MESRTLVPSDYTAFGSTESFVYLRLYSNFNTGVLALRGGGFGNTVTCYKSDPCCEHHVVKDMTIQEFCDVAAVVEAMRSPKSEIQTPTSGTPPPNLAVEAEFAKRISSVNPKDERHEIERDWRRRSDDRSSHREREKNDEDRHRSRDEYKEKNTDQDRKCEHAPDKLKAQENKKLLNAKQSIDMIPKTNEELFSYEINWAVCDKHELHERMRPWISKKIIEFLGEEETTLVGYIVSKTKDHIRASEGAASDHFR